VLTAGTRYRAMHTVLSARFPHIPIQRIFLARRIFANPFETGQETRPRQRQPRCPTHGPAWEHTVTHR
jgi:hypothetical protein